MTTIHEYADDANPVLRLTKPVLHPNNRMSVIGHIGSDKARNIDSVAAFPRTKHEHWFRGDSSSGLKGYGLSETVIEYLRDAPRKVTRVFIIVTDESEVIEYDFAALSDGTLVSYSPEQNDSVIGESNRVDNNVYYDKQRVVPKEQARQTFERSEVEIHT